jgi:hypothetical protein
VDLAKVLEQLHEELANLNAAILSLERLQEAGKQRGKQPDWLGEITVPARTRAKRQGNSKLKGDAPTKGPGTGTTTESE